MNLFVPTSKFFITPSDLFLFFNLNVSLLNTVKALTKPLCTVET